MRRLHSLLAIIAFTLLGPGPTGTGTVDLDSGRASVSARLPQDGAGKNGMAKTLVAGTANRREGVASWYGGDFEGLPMANGEPYDPMAMTCAHRDIAKGSLVEVTNLENRMRVELEVKDRGPYHNPLVRILDVSQKGAQELGFETQGLAKVKIRVIRWGKKSSKGNG